MNKKQLLPIIIVGFFILIIGSVYAASAQGENSGGGPKQLIKVNGATPKDINAPAGTPAGAGQLTAPEAADSMRQEFEGGWPAAGWMVMDYSDLDGGEYLFGKRDCRPHSGSYAGWSVGGGAAGAQLGCDDTYPINTNTGTIYGPFDLSDATSAVFTFYVYGQSEYDEACQYDYFANGVSTDGINYSDEYLFCGNWTEGPDGNGYTYFELPLDAWLGEPQVYVGFWMLSDAGDNYTGFMLDDVFLIVDGNPTPTLTPTPTPTKTNLPTETKPPLNLPLALKDFYGGNTRTPTITPTPTLTPTPTVTPTGEQEIDLAASGDALISAANPATNYGSASWTQAGEDDTLRGLYSFDLSSIPAGATINQAALDLWHFGQGGGCTDHTFTVYRLSETWSELGVTWNTQPAYTEAYGSLTFNTCAALGYRYFDVTALVQAWVDGVYPNYGLLLRQTDNGSGYAIFSSGGIFGDPPYLIIYYSTK